MGVGRPGRGGGGTSEHIFQYNNRINIIIMLLTMYMVITV